jgi:penicillin-binding protein 2
LTSSPLQIASLLCTIANDGYFSQPKLVMSNINNENVQEDIAYPSKEKVLKTNTCKKLIEYMRYVVTDGTAHIMMNGDKKSAGKTATAQTGQYSDGIEKLNTWFIGLYPYDKPKYAIVVMTEQGSSGAEDCCPIFSTIVGHLKKM